MRRSRAIGALVTILACGGDEQDGSLTCERALSTLCSGTLCQPFSAVKRQLDVLPPCGTAGERPRVIVTIRSCGDERFISMSTGLTGESASYAADGRVVGFIRSRDFDPNGGCLIELAGTVSGCASTGVVDEALCVTPTLSCRTSDGADRGCGVP